MIRSLTAFILVAVSALWTIKVAEAQQICNSQRYLASAYQRQLQSAERRLIQQQNAYYNLENRIDVRTLSLQFQVDQAAAQRQSVAGISTGNSVGCVVRSIFWGRGGRCFANSISQTIRMQSRANALYRLAVNRYNSYRNAAASQLVRAQQRVALSQMYYDDALSRFRVAEAEYLECLSQHNSPLV